MTSLNGSRVLVVDDSHPMRVFLSKLLTIAGATVDSAENGDQCLAKGKAGAYDAILLDIELGNQNGLDVAASLRAAGVQTPLLAVTAHGRAEARRAFLAGGFTGVLVKPFGHVELEAALAPLLAATPQCNSRGTESSISRSTSSGVLHR